MRRIDTAAILILAALAAGCYGSGSRSRLSGDASTDTWVPPDAVPDAPVEVRPDVPPDTPIVGWEFVDRDQPDRALRVDLIFSVMPDMAWNGSNVGLVYGGMVLGGDYAVGFVPLDATGSPSGPERLLMEDGGLNASVPRITADGDDGFIMCVVMEIPDRIVMERLASDGTALAHGESPAEMSISDLLSQPVRVGDSVYTATVAYPPGESAIEVYRFGYPGLEFQASAFLTEPETAGEDPVLVKAPGGSGLLMFFKMAAAGQAAFAGIDTHTLAPTGEITTFGMPLVHGSGVHGSASSTDWFGFVFSWQSEERILDFSMFRRDGGWGISAEADFYDPFMDSDASDYPAAGGVTSFLAGDQWDVQVLLEARPPGWITESATMAVNDRLGGMDITDSMNATIAWTGQGFLVVWDEWRPDATDALFSSYVALEPVY